MGKIYDEKQYANISARDLMKFGEVGFIPLNEISTFSNREKYLSLHSAKVIDMLSKNIDRYEDIIRRLIHEFGTVVDEDEDILRSNGSPSLLAAMNIFDCKDGDPYYMIEPPFEE